MTAQIENFIARINQAVASGSRDIRMTPQEAQKVINELAVVLARQTTILSENASLRNRLEEQATSNVEISENLSIISMDVNMDGGKF